MGNVRADPGQIEQVLVSLAANSGDAMISSGKLAIETANVTLDQHYAGRPAFTTPVSPQATPELHHGGRRTGGPVEAGFAPGRDGLGGWHWTGEQAEDRVPLRHSTSGRRRALEWARRPN